MYIDPNTGGILFQALAVIFGLFSGTILFFSGRIRKYFAKLRRQKRERDMLKDEKPVSDDEVNTPAA